MPFDMAAFIKRWFDGWRWKPPICRRRKGIYTTSEVEVRNMSEENNEHQRFLKQQANRKKQLDFYYKHGRLPEDSEISEAPTSATSLQQEYLLDDDLFDDLFVPRD